MTKTSRDKLADVALKLFAKKGYRETSVGDIEDAAGLTRRAGGFYRHFRSKEAVLIDGVQRMARKMIGEIRLEDILAQGDVRAQLLFIAHALMAHAAEHRALRLLLQREAHKMPTLRKAVKDANLTLARQDIAPWMRHTLRRARKKADATTFAFIVFGPVLLYLISQDRNQPAFGLAPDAALTAWADYWSAQLEPKRGKAE